MQLYAWNQKNNMPSIILLLIFSVPVIGIAIINMSKPKTADTSIPQVKDMPNISNIATTYTIKGLAPLPVDTVQKDIQPLADVKITGFINIGNTSTLTGVYKNVIFTVKPNEYLDKEKTIRFVEIQNNTFIFKKNTTIFHNVIKKETSPEMQSLISSILDL